MTVIASASQEAKIDDSGLEVHEEDDGEVKQASKICNNFFQIGVTPPFYRKIIVFPLKITEKICNDFFWIGNDPPPF